MLYIKCTKLYIHIYSSGYLLYIYIYIYIYIKCVYIYNIYIYIYKIIYGLLIYCLLIINL